MVLDLPQELTHAQANVCLAQLVEGLKKQSGPDVVLNASGLQRFDSAALAVLLEFKRQCMASSKRFSIQGMPKQLGDLATLYGIAELLPLATAPVSSPVK
jgi:phospholipid transport system transporter-binding protein